MNLPKTCEIKYVITLRLCTSVIATGSRGHITSKTSYFTKLKSYTVFKTPYEYSKFHGLPKTLPRAQRCPQAYGWRSVVQSLKTFHIPSSASLKALGLVTWFAKHKAKLLYRNSKTAQLLGQVWLAEHGVHISKAVPLHAMEALGGRGV
jgi:hypothetical protein